MKNVTNADGFRKLSTSELAHVSGGDAPSGGGMWDDDPFTNSALTPIGGNGIGTAWGTWGGDDEGRLVDTDGDGNFDMIVVTAPDIEGFFDRHFRFVTGIDGTKGYVEYEKVLVDSHWFWGDRFEYIPIGGGTYMEGRVDGGISFTLPLGGSITGPSKVITLLPPDPQ